MSQVNINYIIGCILIRAGLTTPEELEALRVKIENRKERFYLKDWQEFLEVKE